MRSVLQVKKYTRVYWKWASNRVVIGHFCHFILGYALHPSSAGQKHTRVLVSKNKKDTRVLVRKNKKDTRGPFDLV